MSDWHSLLIAFSGGFLEGMVCFWAGYVAGRRTTR